MTDTNPNPAPVPPAGDYEFAGRAVAAGRGWDWIAQAFALFRKQPGMWLLMTVALCAMVIVISLIPILGSLANTLLLPIFGGGLMLGCKALDRGGELEFEDLFAGFKQKTGDLVLMGAFNLIGWVVIVFAVIAVIGGGVFMGVMRGGVAGAGLSIASMLLALLLGAGLTLPLAMAAWFAPVLIVLQDLSAGAALKASFFACLKNWIPFVVYGVVMLLLCMVAAIPLFLGYLVPQERLGTELGTIIAASSLFLGFLVLLPVVIASVYTAYRDIFCAGQAA